LQHDWILPKFGLDSLQVFWNTALRQGKFTMVAKNLVLLLINFEDPWSDARLKKAPINVGAVHISMR
jgi:hypothetical protein